MTTRTSPRGHDPAGDEPVGRDPEGDEPVGYEQIGGEPIGYEPVNNKSVGHETQRKHNGDASTHLFFGKRPGICRLGRFCNSLAGGSLGMLKPLE